MSINSSTKVRAWLRAAAFDQPSCMAEDSPDAPGGEQEAKSECMMMLKKVQLDEDGTRVLLGGGMITTRSLPLLPGRAGRAPCVVVVRSTTLNDSECDGGWRAAAPSGRTLLAIDGDLFFDVKNVNI